MDKILVLDFGGQYAHLITNRIRRLGIYSEIAPADTPLKTLKSAKGIILSGGPNSVYAKDAPKFNQNMFKLKIPILGICYGHQLMTYAMKGKVKPGKVKEYGLATVDTKPSSLFKGLSKKETVWMSHGDSVNKVPEGFKITASTLDCPIAGMENEKRKYYGVQFHPEVTHTKHGMTILRNFLKATKIKKNWSMKKYLAQIKTQIKEKAKGKNVFLLVSGGVDSSVCFALLNKLLGPKRVLGLHIDNGFMRKDESKDVMKAMKKFGFDNLKIEDASEHFLNAVSGVIKPEEKRRIIGEEFITVYNQAVKKLKLDSSKWLLAQGTIYPDTIETGGTKHSALIKTHHNRVPLLQKMIKQGLVLEPIAGLYKDEVRELGKLLGLPSKLVDRHPFPGPGLSVRCLCSNGREKPQGRNILSLKSVGVQGDFRTYRHPAVIDKLGDFEKTDVKATDMINRSAKINRVIVKLAGKGPFKTHKATLTRDRLDLLRSADDIVTKILRKTKLYSKIWQMPVVLIPVGKEESIVLRPIHSTEAMTASFYRIPKLILKQMTKELMKLPISAVFFDVTNKPPGTIEWE